ncbi:MAG: hypothetical protein H7X88_01665 [Gloeobacteraceae cyanobacterium ES-bin-316]|nr:hypothetical protein [Ferruginibacter sp.]
MAKATFGEIMLGLFSGALETVGESKLIEVLENLRTIDEPKYQAAIYGGHALVSALVPVVTKTGTKIDDAIINALGDAIEMSATMNGLTLSVPVVVSVPQTDPIEMEAK